MNETWVTVVGNVASPVTFGRTSAGVAVANFQLAATERHYDRGRAAWVDGETHWVRVVAWRWLAGNVVSSVGKGDPVVVSGRLRVREWTEEGRRRSGVEVEARTVGHDLTQGTSMFRRGMRARPELVASVRAAGDGAAGALEPGQADASGELAGWPGAVSPGGRPEPVRPRPIGPGSGQQASSPPGPVAVPLPDWIVAAVAAGRAAESAAARGCAPEQSDETGGTVESDLTAQQDGTG